MKYLLLGFLLGFLYGEILYHMTKIGKVAIFVSMPIRIVTFAFVLAFMARELFDYFWLVGGFFVGLVLNLYLRGWFFNGLSKLSRTDFEG